MYIFDKKEFKHEQLYKLDTQLLLALTSRNPLDGNEELHQALSYGSALTTAQNILYLVAGRLASQAARNLLLKPAATALVSSLWFAIKYPVIGPIVKLMPGLFGPPGFIAVAAVQLAALPLEKLVAGVQETLARRTQRDTTRVALPACLAVALVDGVFRIEELRLLRDLFLQSPIEEQDQMKQEMLTLSEITTGDQALTRVREVMKDASHCDARQVLRYTILMAHSDGYPDSAERKLITQVAGILGISEKDCEKQSKEIEEEYFRQQFVNEATIRALYEVAAAADVLEESSGILEAILVMGFSPESERRRIAESLEKEVGSPRGLHWPGSKIDSAFPLEAEGMFVTIFKLATSEQKKVKKTILEEGARFLTAIEKPDLDAEERVLFAGRNRLMAIAEEYDFKGKYWEDLLKDAKNEHLKNLQKLAKIRKDTHSSACPTCDTFGRFELSEQRYTQRNEYRCRECGQKVHMCGWRACSTMVPTGVWYDDHFCMDHFLLRSFFSSKMDSTEKEVIPREGTAAPEPRVPGSNAIQYDLQIHPNGGLVFKNEGSSRNWFLMYGEFDEFASQQLDIKDGFIRVKASAQVFSQGVEMLKKVNAKTQFTNE